MANRTIQFLGNGYAPAGTDPITISATLDGNVVYTGTIPTSYTSEINHAADSQAVLFTCEIPVDFSGTVPMSISLDNSVGVTVFFEQIESNYMPVQNSVFTPEEISILTNPATPRADKVTIWTAKAVPPLSAEDITILETGTLEQMNTVRAAHNIELDVSSGPSFFTGINGAAECRSNVVVNGAPGTRQPDPVGTWGWIVEFPAEGSGLFEYDLTIQAGQE